jgi:hypothetical protein
MELSAQERRFRSRMAQLVHQNRLLRGTLTTRARRCGKANCRCARGEPHTSLYLVTSREGKPRQICVPHAWEARVRRAVADYRELAALLEEISELELARLRERRE